MASLPHSKCPGRPREDIRDLVLSFTTGTPLSGPQPSGKFPRSILTPQHGEVTFQAEAECLGGS